MLDREILKAVNRHQRGDKGFGPALGPAAAKEAILRFEGLGYAVTSGKSDWLLGANDGKVQRELIEGWAAAAREIGGFRPAELDAWRTCRQLDIAAGRSTIIVGHIDFFARPITAL
jgi:hypothetical protein